MKDCTHNKVTCLSQYTLIRKYICESCQEIMMCKCDEEFGRKFLSHQLDQASWQGSRKRVPVTLGFQENVCPECREGKAVSAPKAPRYGAITKIRRYYWREIFFETTGRLFDSHPELDHNDIRCMFSFPDERKDIEKEVIAEIKHQHELNPKYEYDAEITQEEVIEQTNTEFIQLNAEYVNTEERKVGIRNGNKVSTVEEFASDYFKTQGYEVLEVESVPFHVLFGVFMYLVIQDDEMSQIVQFGSRNDFDSGLTQEGVITTFLPDDFGSNLYYERQKEFIQSHLNELEDLDWLFDYWIDNSSNFRQYLWAHRKKDVLKAKKVMSILGLSNLQKLLHYMAMDYWKNYCGWPDLLVFNNTDFFFVEVKSRNDKLSKDQKHWLLGNHEHMGFKVKIVKVSKK